MSKHTESPWRWDRKHDMIVAANGSVICKIATGEDRAEEDANARLIQAAPELLAACKAVVGMVESIHEVPPTRFKRLRAAISKAEGE